MSHDLASSLSNKRFALIGIQARERYAIADALATAHASGEEVAWDTAMPSISAFDPYDALILDFSRISEDSAEDDVALAKLDQRPAIAITDECALIASELASGHLQWEVIVRPLRTPELLMRLARLIVRSNGKTSTRRRGTVRRVLVVDDDATVRALQSTVLENAGFQCDCVPSASEALAALAGGHHDLVLLDLGMPDIDGFKVLKAIRNSNADCRPAVVIVTSATREEDITRGFGLGADDYVTKPFKPRELIARCERALRNRESANGEIAGLTPELSAARPGLNSHN
jgi:CheY-like chemotaxis protein